MKKVISLVLGCTLTGSVFASNILDLDPQFYAGGELKVAKSKFGSKFSDAASSNYGSLVPHKTNLGLGLLAGIQLNPYAALEFGYTTFRVKKSSITVNDGEKLGLKYKPKNMYLDVLGFLPLDNQYKLIGSLGLGRLKNSIHVDDIASTVMAAGELKNSLGNHTKTRIRFGVGAQLDWDQNWGFRMMLRRQQGNDVVRSMDSLSLGTIYKFI